MNALVGIVALEDFQIGRSEMTLARPHAALPLEEGTPIPPEGRLTAEHIHAELHALYREESPRLVRHLARHTHCGDTARDLAHEAFLRLAQLAPIRAAGIRQPQAYLRKISTNLLKDWGRSHSRRDELLDSLDDSTTAPDQIAVLESRDTLRRVERALAKMKPKTREIFLAHRLEGLSYAEIAQRTGLTISGVEKQMIKAIAKIDRFLDRT